MPRAKDTAEQARSRTAVLGYLAAAAAGRTLDRPGVVRWLTKRGLAIGDGGLKKALELRLRRQGTEPSSAPPDERDWIRETVDFDPTKLDLDLAILVFPGHERSERLVEVLRSTERVVRVYEAYDGDLVALLVYDGAREHRQLRVLLEEHEPRMHWIVIREVSDAAAESTWLSLANKVAQVERLLKV